MGIGAIHGEWAYASFSSSFPSRLKTSSSFSLVFLVSLLRSLSALADLLLLLLLVPYLLYLYI